MVCVVSMYCSVLAFEYVLISGLDCEYVLFSSLGCECVLFGGLGCESVLSVIWDVSNIDQWSWL